MSYFRNGIPEFVQNPEEITDKVIFLLGESMKYYLRNLKVDFLKKPDNKDNFKNYKDDSKLFIYEKEQNISSLNSLIDISAVIKSKDLIKHNKLICSFESMNKIFKFEYPLDKEISNINSSDILHKIIFNNYANKYSFYKESKSIIENLSLTYQFLTSYTSLFCVV